MYEYPKPIYNEDFDALGEWFSNLPNGKYRSSELCKSFNGYLASIGEHEISNIRFTRRFVVRGGVKTRGTGGTILEKVFMPQDDTEI